MLHFEDRFLWGIWGWQTYISYNNHAVSPCSRAIAQSYPNASKSLQEEGMEQSDWQNCPTEYPDEGAESGGAGDAMPGFKGRREKEVIPGKCGVIFRQQRVKVLPTASIPDSFCLP